jgi:hypothetical protein
VVPSGCNFGLVEQDFADNSTQVRLCNVAFPDSDGAPSQLAIVATSYSSSPENFFYNVDTAEEYVWSVLPNYVSYPYNKSHLGVPDPLVVIGYFKVNGTESVHGVHPRTATKCVLDFCVRDYNISVVAGQPAAEVTSTRWGEKSKYNWQVPNTIDNKTHPQDLQCWKGSNTPVSELNLEPLEYPPATKASSARKGYVDRHNLAFCSATGGSTSDITWQWEWQSQMSNSWRDRLAQVLSAAAMEMRVFQS